MIIWVFPKIVVTPNHSFLIGFSILNHPFWGYLFLETPICRKLETRWETISRFSCMLEYDFTCSYITGLFANVSVLWGN